MLSTQASGPVVTSPSCLCEKTNSPELLRLRNVAQDLLVLARCLRKPAQRKRNSQRPPISSRRNKKRCKPQNHCIPHLCCRPRKSTRNTSVTSSRKIECTEIDGRCCRDRLPSGISYINACGRHTRTSTTADRMLHECELDLRLAREIPSRTQASPTTAGAILSTPASGPGALWRDPGARGRSRLRSRVPNRTSIHPYLAEKRPRLACCSSGPKRHGTEIWVYGVDS